MTKKSHYKAWVYLARSWEKYIMPPSKPCKTQLEIWGKILRKVAEKNKNPRALILGATPELRDLCFENNFRTVVCDINPLMIKGMASLMRHKNNRREKIVVGNWLKVNFPKDSFDIIMGDASLNQILRAKDVSRVVRKLFHALKPDGLLLIREVVKLNSKPIVRGKEEWIRWFSKYQKGGITNMDLYNFYKYQSDANIYRKSPSIIDVLLMFDKLDELSKEVKGFKKFVNWLDKALGRKSKPLLVFLKKDLEKLLEKYFKLLPIKQCYDNKHCKYMPLFLAKPKK